MTSAMASTENLPDELVSIILSLLVPTERFKAMQVCRRWRSLARRRRIWRRGGEDWAALMACLHTWLKVPPPAEDMDSLGEVGETLHADLFKREGAGTFTLEGQDPVPSDTRAWLDRYSGVSNKLMRTTNRADVPLVLNFVHELLPGFSHGDTAEMFEESNEESFTWVEGSSIKKLRMWCDTGRHRLLEVKLHRVASLPIAMEFLQEVRAATGKLVVRTTNIYQKLRSDATTRIEKELSEDVAAERESGVWLEMPGVAEGRLVGTIAGPEGTPYQGGRWRVEITVPRQYPFSPPKCRFLTKIWHPNVDHRTGEACLIDIPPSLLLIKILVHFQGLLSFPNPEDPVDLEVAAQARDRPQAFAATARHWTWSYANPTSPGEGMEEKVARVVEVLGVTREDAMERLSLVDWDIDSIMDVQAA